MGDPKPILNHVHTMQFPYNAYKVAAPGLLPAQYNTQLLNATPTQIPFQLLASNIAVVQNIEHAFRDLLWNPDKFVVELLLATWSAILAAPPLIRFALCYILIRHTLYRWAVWAVNDYQKHLDLGRGGTSCDIWGWWRVKRLKFMAAINVFDPPHVPPMMDPYRGLLWDIPRRQGDRPIVKGIAPQRQVTQKTPVSTFELLSDMLAAFAQSHPEHLRLERSFLEGHTTALKANQHAWIGVPGAEGEFGFEICHPHRHDGSLHLIMHPEDICTVLEAGWGERHPLATNVWYWRWWYHRVRRQRKPVPEYLVFIYAPRNDEELEVVYRIIRAAIWFATKQVLNADMTQKVICK